MLLGTSRTLLLTAVTALAAIWAPGPASAEEIDGILYEQPGPVPLLGHDYGLEPAQDVLLTDDRLSPRRVEVRQGERIRWQSVSRHASRIVFEREVARAMVCHSLVNFELSGDRLRSAPLQTGDTASFCRLKPGTYRYRVVRDGPSEWPIAGAVQLSNRLEGVIVVKPAATPVAAR